MDVSNYASLQPQPGQAQCTGKPYSKDVSMNYDKKDAQLGTDSTGAMQLMDLADLALQFLSTCSNEMLLFVLACLMGATYILLGRLGLIIIGMTLGIALHASWEGSVDHSVESQSSSKRQLSLNIVHRLLEWQTNKRVESDQGQNNIGEIVSDGKLDLELDSSSFGLATATALQSLIDAAVRNYVNYWYEPILPSESTFPLSCQQTLTGFITSISSHLCRKRTASAFLEFLTNSSSMVIVFLNELSTAFEAAGPTRTAEHAVSHYLDSNHESSLASLLADQQQRKKLTMISDDMLSRFLEPAAYNCIPLRNFLREVLAGIVFESTISSLSRPEFINGWIIHLFSEGESEIMSAIDAGVEGARTQGVTAVRDSREITRPGSISADVNIAGSTSPSNIPSQALNKLDQATEEAMMEAKRLSDLIAAQDLRKYAEEIKQNGVREGEHANNGDDIFANKNMENMTREESATEGAVLGDETAERFQNKFEVRQSELGGSLSSPSLNSPETPPTNLPSEGPDKSPSFSLHRASITVDDGMDSGGKAALRSKPTSSYLLQVEPRSGRTSGWMVFRKYSEFESIHETLGTISRLNQLRFGDSHPVVPPWKGRTSQALARDLERYLQDALQLEPLAESVRMKRFLEKDGGLGAEPSDSSSKPFVFPGQGTFGNVGKGVLGVLTNAPKGVSGGGKAVFEGVTGVFGGGLSNKKTSAAPGTNSGNRSDGGSLQTDGLSPKVDASNGNGGLVLNDGTIDGAASSQVPDSSDTPGLISPSEVTSLAEISGTPTRASEFEENSNNATVDRASSEWGSANRTNIDFGSINTPEEKNSEGDLPETRKSTEAARQRKGQGSPITTDETRMAVELIFAVINELYSLSSAWNIRRTLLNAAKSYMLRPGNPSLETIRELLQESMINSNTSDEAIGLYLVKLRENALPTAAELSSWSPPMSDAEKERQKETARRVLVQKGLPQAITSVMGAVASREALGKVFDSLQVEPVARGFVFSILLQALRALVL